MLLILKQFPHSILLHEQIYVSGGERNSFIRRESNVLYIFNATFPEYGILEWPMFRFTGHYKIPNFTKPSAISCLSSPYATLLH
jgi:hypothetical protein